MEDFCQKSVFALRRRRLGDDKGRKGFHGQAAELGSVLKNEFIDRLDHPIVMPPGPFVVGIVMAQDKAIRFYFRVKDL